MSAFTLLLLYVNAHYFIDFKFHVLLNSQTPNHGQVWSLPDSYTFLKAFEQVPFFC